MFVHLADLIKEHLGEVSWTYLKYRLTLPEMYLCSSISDFTKNQEKIIPTGWRLLNPGKDWNREDSSYILFYSGYFKKRSKLGKPSQEMLGEALTRNFLIRDLTVGSKSSKGEELKEVLSYWRKGLPQFAQADIYDLTGDSIPIYRFPSDTPEGKLYDLVVPFCPSSTFAEIIDYGTHSSVPKIEENKATSTI